MDPLWKYLLVPVNLILLLPITGNTFIFSVNIMNLIEQKRLCVTDQLITGISVFSLLLGFIELNNWLSRVIQSDTFFYGDHRNSAYAYSFPVLLCYLWFSAWLCVHFCLKIVTINQRFYRCLQRGFPKMFPWILIFLILGSMLVSLPIIFNITKGLSPPNTILGYSNQSSSPRDKICGTHVCLYQTYFVACLLGFLLCSMSAVTIIWSLYRHVIHMRDNAEGSRSPNMEAHIRAVKTVTSILIVNIILFTILAIYIFKNGDYLWQCILSIIISIFHLICSLNLIKGNRKLDEKLSYILSRCHFFTQCNNPTLS
ncbi:taste receptor type 2 member 40-like [Pelodytes ibericus]